MLVMLKVLSGGTVGVEVPSDATAGDLKATIQVRGISPLVLQRDAPPRNRCHGRRRLTRPSHAMDGGCLTIQSKYGAETSSQKLVYAGSVVDDAASLEDLGVVEETGACLQPSVEDRMRYARSRLREHAMTHNIHCSHNARALGRRQAQHERRLCWRCAASTRKQQRRSGWWRRGWRERHHGADREWCFPRRRGRGRRGGRTRLGGAQRAAAQRSDAHSRRCV